MSSKALVPQSTAELANVSPEQLLTIEQVVYSGDCTPLTALQRMIWYKNRCDAVGADYRTQPFDWIILNGKLVLYARAALAEQLAAKRGISTALINSEIKGNLYVVTCRATEPDGRFTDATGVVSIVGLVGDAICNAIMKAETKAKRRAVKSLTGFGVMDESELDTVKNITRSVVDLNTGEILPSGQKAIAAAPRELTPAEIDTRLRLLRRWKVAVDDAAGKWDNNLLPRVISRPLSSGFVDSSGKRVSAFNATFRALTDEEAHQLATFLDDPDALLAEDTDDDDEDDDEPLPGLTDASAQTVSAITR